MGEWLNDVRWVKKSIRGEVAQIGGRGEGIEDRLVDRGREHVVT